MGGFVGVVDGAAEIDGGFDGAALTLGMLDIVGDKDGTSDGVGEGRGVIVGLAVGLVVCVGENVGPVGANVVVGFIVRVGRGDIVTGKVGLLVGLKVSTTGL